MSNIATNDVGLFAERTQPSIALAEAIGMPKRLIVPHTVYHVISRFVDREWFFNNDAERARYLALLHRGVAHSDWLLLAYALMSNHIHLSLLSGFDPPKRWLARVNGPFATWMNERHDRIGPMFVRGPSMWAMRPQDEGHLIAYIHNNPVRAGVVKHARDSRWTSHRAYLRNAPPWLAVGEGLERSGFTGRPREFDAWVDDTVWRPEIAELDGIRRATRKRGALEIATPTAGFPIEVPLLKRPFGHVRLAPEQVIEVVARVSGLPIPVLCSRRRTPDAIDARRIAVDCGRAAGLSQSDLADALGISRQAVSMMASIPRSNLNGSMLELVRAQLAR